MICAQQIDINSSTGHQSDVGSTTLSYRNQGSRWCRISVYSAEAMHDVRYNHILWRKISTTIVQFIIIIHEQSEQRRTDYVKYYNK